MSIEKAFVWLLGLFLTAGVVNNGINTAKDIWACDCSQKTK